MEATSAPAPAARGVTGSNELARNALGLPQILFCIVTGSAPLAAMMFNDPLSGLGIGISVPAAFMIATVSFTFFSVAYIEMARRVTTAGGIYSYTSYGFGRIIGLGTAVGIAAAYMLFSVGVNGVTSYFAQTSIDDLTGFSMDWRIYSYILIALLFIITYFHIEWIARILGLFLLGELVILMIFSFAVVVKGGGPDGMVWQALNPAGIFSGGDGVEGAARVFGASAAGVGFFAAYWSWIGFEMAPNYAEEARNPKKMMAYAIYISCIGLGVLYTFWSWMLISAYGSSKDQWPWAVSQQYGIADAPANVGLPKGDYASVFYPVAQQFAGVAIKDLFQILIITGSFACSLAFWNTANRYLFAMGRERILPSALGRTHSTHKSPFVATVIVGIFVAAVTLLFAAGWVGTGQQAALGVTESDPIVALFQIGTWLPFQGNMLLLPIMALCDLAILVYFLKPENRDGFHWFKTLVAPIIGAGSISFAVWLMLQNRGALTTGSNTGWAFAVPFYALGIFLGGCVLGVIYYIWARKRYDAVGRFVHEEA
jgi:amino acid transporter